MAYVDSQPISEASGRRVSLQGAPQPKPSLAPQAVPPPRPQPADLRSHQPNDAQSTGCDACPGTGRERRGLGDQFAGVDWASSAADLPGRCDSAGRENLAAPADVRMPGNSSTSR